MKHRWTMKDLRTMSDDEILRLLVNERKSDLNVYAPLYQRLAEIGKNLDKKIVAARVLDAG